MNYYISDLHFGCTNKFEDRTLEHDKMIIDNWNRTVTNADTVYILGDIGKIGGNQNIEYVCKCISVLKGRKVLVLGNHDKGLKDIRLRQLFIEVCDYKEVSDNYNGLNHNVVLSHYPILIWNHQHKGWLHLYGHVHASKEWDVYKDCLNHLNDYFKEQTLLGRTDCPEAMAYNVCCMLDYMQYTPRTLKEIISSNKIKYI
jgi:calcineurin-like phosphoesterase family protein